MAKNEKLTKYRNCSVCEERTKCWRSESYGDRGERGKKPYPTEALCIRFKLDDKFKRW
jgi:hypothetical protein